ARLMRALERAVLEVRQRELAHGFGEQLLLCGVFEIHVGKLSGPAAHREGKTGLSVIPGHARKRVNPESSRTPSAGFRIPGSRRPKGCSLPASTDHALGASE